MGKTGAPHGFVAGPLYKEGRKHEEKTNAYHYQIFGHRIVTSTSSMTLSDYRISVGITDRKAK